MSNSLDNKLREILARQSYSIEAKGGDAGSGEQKGASGFVKITPVVSDTFSPKNNGRYFGSLVKELKKRVEGL